MQVPREYEPARRAHDRVRDGGVLLFRVGGVPVLLAPSWWIGSVIVGALYAPLAQRILPDTGTGLSWVLAAAFVVLLGASVLAHELGHCLIALRLGHAVRRVRLFLLGGFTEVTRPPRHPRHEGLIAVAGPVVSLGLAALCWLLLLAIPGYGAAWLLLAQCAVANLAVGVFNLLPGLPLDGGRLLRAGVWAAAGRRLIGTRIAAAGGGVVAVGLLVWALWGLAQGSDDRWLRLGICVVTAWFVVTGATGEFAAEADRTSGVSVTELLYPVLQLPAESPVSAALAASAGRGVVLVRADGVAVGLLDAATAERLAATAPLSPAESAAEPVRAETVLVTRDGDDIAEHVLEAPSRQFLVVDAGGRPTGVLCRSDVSRALAARRHTG